MKICKKCQKSFSEKFFSKSSTTSDGLYPYCKHCYHEYYRQRYRPKLRNIIMNDTHRQCRICLNLKSWSEFASMKSTYCSECSSLYMHLRNIKKYNMSVDKYVAMLQAQDFKCKICFGTDTKRLSIDHNHACCDGQFSCGKCIRGLICSRCNKTLGMISDDIQILQSMINYLNNS